MFYDPMIAKLITWAPTREAAIDAQVEALDAFEIDGISDNVDFLSALMQHPRFRAGNLDHRLHRRRISRRLPRRARRTSELAERPRRHGRAWSRRHTTPARARDRRPAGRRRLPGLERVVRIDGRRASRRIKPYDGGKLAIVDDGEPVDVIGRLGAGPTAAACATSTAASASSRSRRNGRGWKLTTRGARAQGAGAAAARRRAGAAHDREGAAGPVAVAAGADAGAADAARRQGRRQGRGRPAGRGDGGDEDGEHPPRREEPRRSRRPRPRPATASPSIR